MINLSSLIDGFRTVLLELNTPSSMKNDWFSWAAGQMAHAMIGAILAGALLFFLSPISAFVVTILGYTLAKEIPDYLRAPGWAGARDSAQDALFVTAGASLAVAIGGAHSRLFFVALGASFGGLVLGIWTRIAHKEGSNE